MPIRGSLRRNEKRPTSGSPRPKIQILPIVSSAPSLHEGWAIAGNPPDSPEDLHLQLHLLPAWENPSSDPERKPYIAGEVVIRQLKDKLSALSTSPNYYLLRLRRAHAELPDRMGHQGGKPGDFCSRSGFDQRVFASPGIRAGSPAGRRPGHPFPGCGQPRSFPIHQPPPPSLRLSQVLRGLKNSARNIRVRYGWR